MRIILRNASWVCTCDEARPWITRGHVSVKDGVIEAVQDSPIELPADDTIDLDGCLLTNFEVFLFLPFLPQTSQT